MTTFRRRSVILGARYSTEKLCLELARVLLLGARVSDFAVMIADCADSAWRMHRVEVSPNA